FDEFKIGQVRAAARRSQSSEFWRSLVLGDDRHERAGARLPEAGVRIVILSNEIWRTWLGADSWAATPSVEMHSRLAVCEASLDSMNSFQNDAHDLPSIRLKQMILVVAVGR